MAFLYTGFGGSDNTISWPGWGKTYITNLHASRRGFCGGLDGPAGHEGPGISPIAQFNAIRLNESYPAFTNVSGNPAIPLTDAPGTLKYEINTQFMWSTPHWRAGGWQNQVDQTNRYEIVIVSTDGNQIGDITPRRLQHFIVQNGKNYMVKNTSVSDTSVLYQVKTITADQYGLVTFQGFQIKAGDQSSGGSRFIMAPAVPVSTNENAPAGDARPGISCSYNPFNSSLSIDIGSSGHQRLRVLVYNVSGQCVADLTPSMANGRGAWDASVQQSGTYFITAYLGNKVLVKRVTHIR